MSRHRHWRRRASPINHRANNRRELIATCQRNGRRYDIALLDIGLNADPETSRLIAAYRRWTGA